MERAFSSKLGDPITINTVTVRNRIVMPAFGLKYCGIDRKPSQRLADFYEERSRGGCGLLVIGGVGIDFTGSGLMVPSIESDDFIEPWTRLLSQVRRHGARVFLQLFHSGRYQHSALIRGEQAVAPSAVPSRYTRETPRELTVDQIEEIVERFAAAAGRTQAAGADGVEVIASAGYLICQFLSPATNLRTDGYGGSFENRCRFGTEVIRAVRKRVGPDFPVGFRLSGAEFVPGGNTNREIVAAARVFAAAGLDYVSVTGGWHETLVPQLPSMVPRSAYAYLARNIRMAVDVPVMAANRIVDADQARAILADGLADMVAVGRGQIADPHWARKALGGGPAIRPCVGCLQGCLDRLFSMRDVECLCNPVAGHEADRSLSPAQTPKRIAVVGAGPAGLEAALVASARGHTVAVFEKAPLPGGQLPLVAAAPGRAEFVKLLEFYLLEARRNQLDIRLDVADTLAALAEWKPDHVILATGSRAALPDIPGLDGPNVVHAWDVLLRKAPLGRDVVVLGGGAVGIETALAIADRGTLDGETLKFLLKHDAEDPATLKSLATTSNRKVTVIEKQAKLGADVGPTSRWVFLKELELLSVRTVLCADVTAVAPRSVRFSKDGEASSLPADTVVVALGSTAVNDLEGPLAGAGIPFSTVGDAKKPRKLMDAIHEAFLTASRL